MKDDVVICSRSCSRPWWMANWLVDEWEQALALAEDAQGQANWQLYHLVGDVLRSPDLAHHSQHDLLSGLRAQLAQEPPLSATGTGSGNRAAELAAESVGPRGWQWLRCFGASASAGLSVGPAARPGGQCLGVPVEIGLPVLPQSLPWRRWASTCWRKPPRLHGAGRRLAQTAAPMWWPWRPRMAKRSCLRDPNLDALLTLHEQYGTRPSLQVPAEFLRNAGLAHTSAQRTAP